MSDIEQAQLPAPADNHPAEETEDQARTRIHAELLEKAAPLAAEADAMVIVMVKDSALRVIHTPVMQQIIITMLEDASLSIKGFVRKADVDAMIKVALDRFAARQKLLGPSGMPVVKQ